MLLFVLIVHILATNTGRIFSVKEKLYLNVSSTHNSKTNPVKFVRYVKHAHLFNILATNSLGSVYIADNSDNKNVLTYVYDGKSYIHSLKNNGSTLQHFYLGYIPGDIFFISTFDREICFSVKGHKLIPGDCKNVFIDNSFHFCYENINQKNKCKNKFVLKKKIQNKKKSDIYNISSIIDAKLD